MSVRSWERLTAKQRQMNETFEKEAAHLIASMKPRQLQDFATSIPPGVPVQEMAIIRLGCARRALGMSLSPFVSQKLAKYENPKPPVVRTLSQSLREARGR